MIQRLTQQMSNRIREVPTLLRTDAKYQSCFALGVDKYETVRSALRGKARRAPVSRLVSPTARLLVDIDLSILGSPAERFERYDQDVRKEYAWVPGYRYRQARAQVLQSFLDRPSLYHGEAAVALLQSQARINLAAALSRLAQ